MKRRIKLTVTGTVQGVGYRASARNIARSLGLTGYAANMPDGTVEIVAEGEEPLLRKLIDWAREGPSLAHVENVDAEWSDATGEFDSFVTR